MRTCFVALLVLTSAACTAPSGPDQAGPGASGSVAGGDAAAVTFEDRECPEDVRGVVFGDADCGTIEVPLRPPGATGTAEVFVVRIRATADQAGDPIVVLPAIGSTPNYLGIAPLAQRTGREVIVVDGRGTGHSTPSLDCPEVTRSTTRALGGRADAATAHEDYLASVEACASRLRAEGVEPAAFTLRDAAADIAALRLALGIDAWTVAAYGSGARLAPELMDLDGDAVTSLVLDSPELPGTDPVGTALTRTHVVVEALLRECAQDNRCRTRYPRPHSLWSRALAAVRQTPLGLDAGRLGRVRVDETMLVRLARQVVSDGGSSGLAFTPGSLPGVLRDVADRGGPWLNDEIAPLLAEQDPFCVGHLSDCLLRMRVSAGAYLTQLCHDVLPFTDAPIDVNGDPSAPGFRPRAGTEACRRWDVGTAETSAPVDWEAPTLTFVGRFSPYVTVAEVRRGVARLPNGSVLVDPGGADNVLPRTDCALDLRGTWIDAPTGDVDAPPCLRRQRMTWQLAFRS